jgi:hypothetical protein
MGAKVRRKKLCQGGVLFGSLMSREIFELGDRDEGGLMV